MKSIAMSLATALVAAACPAAAVTTYTTQAAFDAAVTGELTFGFNEGNTANHYHVAANPYTKLGVTFSDNVTAADTASGGSPLLFLIGAASTPTYGVDFLSFQNTDGGGAGAGGISADITSPGVTAIGFDFGTYVAAGPATVSVDGGAPIAIDPSGTLSFIGFTSATPITDVSIFVPAATGYSFDITSVSIAGGVPEPASWALMIVGLGLVGAAARRGSAPRSRVSAA